MRTYHIEINENQAEMISAALYAYAPDCFEPADNDERDILATMFASLADVADDETGANMLHGFTL